MRTTIGGRAVSLAAVAALLVMLASADAAARASGPGLRDAVDGRSTARTNVVGLGRLVEGLLACATVPDEGFVARAESPMPVICSSAQVAGCPAALLGLPLLIDLPPPALG